MFAQDYAPPDVNQVVGKTGSPKPDQNVTKVEQAKPIDPASIRPDKVAAATANTKKKPVSPFASVNLINALVAKGSLTEEQGAELIRQAEDEAYIAREAAKTATEKADTAQTAADKAAATVPEKGARRVAYVPEIVKKQIADDVQSAVFVKAEREGWAAPNALPEWTKRIRITGDVRTRYEGVRFPKGNCTVCLIDFNTINSGSGLPINVSGNADSIPQYDVDQDRDRFRLRARLGIEANLMDNFYVGTRIGTGESNAPISLNQTFGANGGNFSKYQIWLDRAYIAYKYAETRDNGLKDGGSTATGNTADVLLGRFDNPFLSTDLIWDPNLGFDGAAARLQYAIDETNFTTFYNFGAFPLYNTPFNTPTNGLTKSSSDDRYLFGGQGGFKSKVDDTTELTLASAFYDFYNVKGKLSSPCLVLGIPVSGCDTDLKRPGFAQKGNTYLNLRNVVNQTPPVGYNEYYGLASDFEVLTANAKFDFGYFSPFRIILEGEFVKNLAFDKKALSTVAINNRGPDVRDATNKVISTGVYAGGDTGYLVKATFGKPKLQELGDWNVSVAYRYLESDATVDAFTYSDFGLGGTNLQGYIIGGQLGLGKNVFSEVKWLSADNIAGGPYSVDIVQVDLNAKF